MVVGEWQVCRRVHTNLDAFSAEAESASQLNSQQQAILQWLF